MKTSKLIKQIDWLCKIDSLKNIIRQSYLLDQNRRENSAEHSWHVALAALTLSEYSNHKIDILHVIKMLLLHDIVEIYAGDTFLYDEKQKANQHVREMQAANSIFKLLPEPQGQNLKELWLEFEEMQTDDAKFAKSIDRLLPVLHNYFNAGITWKKKNLTKQQVINNCQIISQGSEELWSYAAELIENGEEHGYFNSKEPFATNPYSDYELFDSKLGVPLITNNGLQLQIGGFKIKHKNIIDEYAIVYKGNIKHPKQPIMLRINSACYTGDIFQCSRCDCNWQLHTAMRMIEKQNGLIIYHFNQEGRGIGFVDKLKTYAIMDINGKTTKEAFEHIGKNPESRDYYPSVLILNKLGITDVRLISNNPDKKTYLLKHGINITETIPLVSKLESLKQYLTSKKDQFGHTIDHM